jgi:hypothetical protein
MNDLDEGALDPGTGNLQIDVVGGQQHGKDVPIRRVPVDQQSPVADDLMPQDGRSSAEINQLNLQPSTWRLCSRGPSPWRTC